MKKLILWAAPLLLLAACQPKGPTQAEYDAVVAERDSLSGHINEMADLIGTVNSSLDSIALQEGRLFIDNEDGTRASKQQILDRLSTYKELLARQKEQLENLERQQNSSKSSINELKNIIARLRQDIQEREARIIQLEEEVADRDRNIAQLQKTIEEAQATNADITAERNALEQVSTAQDEMLNMGFYIVASRSELKELGLAKGTFKSKADLSNIDDRKFTRVDIRKFTKLVIPGHSPKFLTERPANSYTLTENNDGTTTLNISYPARFWQASPYLIIQSK